MIVGGVGDLVSELVVIHMLTRDVSPYASKFGPEKQCSNADI